MVPTASTAPVESTVSTSEAVDTTGADTTGAAAELLVAAFMAFTHDPSHERFNDLPLADTVDLGLGSSIVQSVDRLQLRQPSAWRLDVDLYRAYTGPFSAFDALSGLG